MESVSMEAFGPVAVDMFTGRRVEQVRGDEGAAVWSIYFEGGGIIHNFDPTLPAPRTIIGAALTMTILGLHKSQFDRTPLTELRFGLEAVQLNPLQYAIFDPQLTRGKLVFAQRSEANMPPGHPDERVAEGPTEEEDEGRVELAESALPDGDVGHLLTEEQKQANRDAAAKEESRLRESEQQRADEYDAQRLDEEPDGEES